MSTTAISANGLKIELDLTAMLNAIDPHGSWEQDWDGDYVPAPTSFRRQIIEETAILLRDAMADHVRKVVTDSVREAIDAKVIEIVSEKLEEGIQRTNDYGSPVGEPQPLRDIIIAQANAALAKNVGGYGKSQTLVSKLVEDHVTTAFKNELHKQVKEVHALTTKAVKDAAAEVISSTIERAQRGLSI